jgi:sugar phosphate isomerase/epimerase
VPLVFSTSWNAFRYDSAREMLFEIEKLGFCDLELSFNLTAAMVDEIKAMAQGNGFNIRSVHNFSPIPEGLSREDALPDCFSVAAIDEEERKQAVKYAKRTIDTAASLGAKAVVLHCGRVQMQDETRKLIELYNRGLKDTEAFSQLKEEFVRERAAVATPFLESSLRSLHELNQHAQDKSILLGVENRFYYREIPSFEEVGAILREFKGSNIFYWHDFGHAQVMENLGFGSHKDYLDSYKDAMIGVHLHNIIGCSDHQAPIKGELDFSEFRPYLKKETVKVIEAHHPATAAEIKQSKLMLERVFDDII